jgi:hypothetical protein
VLDSNPIPAPFTRHPPQVVLGITSTGEGVTFMMLWAFAGQFGLLGNDYTFQKAVSARWQRSLLLPLRPHPSKLRFSTRRSSLCSARRPSCGPPGKCRQQRWHSVKV